MGICLSSSSETVMKNQMESKLSEMKDPKEQDKIISLLQMKCIEATEEVSRLNKCIDELKHAQSSVEMAKVSLNEASKLVPFVTLSYDPVIAMQPSLAIVHSSSDVRFSITKENGFVKEMAIKSSPLPGNQSLVAFVHAGEAVCLRRTFPAVVIEGFLVPIKNILFAWFVSQ